MSEKNIQFFADKWYIREDLYPEPIDITSRSIHNCRILLGIGNCFNSKEEALAKCNAIRLLVGVATI